jgi:creatinine amidohydrolase
MDKPKHRGHELEYLTWKEAETLLTSDSIVVIPVGAQMKEHGYHLPLNNDWLTARYLTGRVLELLPIVALPPIAYGHYPAFLEYPGSVSLREEVFRDTILDICRSMHRHGPRKFYVLNNAVSTLRSLASAREILHAEGILLEYTNLIESLSEAEAEVCAQTRGTHADEAETSMMLFIAPEIVRMDLAVKDDRPEIGSGGLTRNPETKAGVYSPSGAWGDPTLATREKGRVLVTALVEHIVKRLQNFMEQ